MIRSLFLLFILPLALTALPQEFPAWRGYVNDFANVIDADTEARITALCTELEQKTKAELAVVTVPTIGDYDDADYVNRLFEKWGIGKKGVDNGVLLFVAVQERRVRLEVGYGLEGLIPDITAVRILDQYVVDDFKQGDYAAGMLRGAQAVAGLIAADAGVEINGSVRPNIGRSRSRNPGGSGKLLFWLILFLLFVRPRWLLPFLLMGGSRRRRGKWGGGGFGGGFGGGGFGGGGFGGFGGGSSGGGGAGRGF